MKDKKKKILKIVQIVYDILSLAFIVFVVVAMAIAPQKSGSHSNEPNTQEVERPNKHNYYVEVNEVSPYAVYIDTGDLFSSKFFIDFIYYVDNIYGTDSGTMLPTTEVDAMKTWTRGGVLTYDGYWGAFRPLSDDKVSTPSSEVGAYSMTLSKDYFYTKDFGDGTLSILCVYQLYWQDISNNTIYSIRYDVYTPLVSDNTKDLGQSIIVIAPNNPLNIGHQWWIYYEDVRFEQHPFLDFCNWLNEGNSYKDASQYKLGYNAGYNKGYLDGSSGVESNAFVVIGQAFTAVSGIFAIEVLPNLPLWVLVFTPLIIAVVVVVVKLIKG